MSGKAEYFSGEHRVSQQLLDWTLNTIAAVPLPILTQTSDAFLHADFRSELTELTIPTLVIHGTADTSMPIDLTARKTAPLIPDCRSSPSTEPATACTSASPAVTTQRYSSSSPPPRRRSPRRR